jgi:D-alanyl-D-alanine carboxypeptidase
MDATASSPTVPTATPVRPHAKHVLSPYAIAPARVHVNPRLKLPLTSGLLFDVRTGRVLWERNPAARLPIARLTKMMTALVVVTHARPTARVLITPQAVHFTGSGVGLLPLGKRVQLRSLLYGLLLPSGNDAAIALAQHVAGTRARFIGMMNAEAARLGLTCTHFSTVSGVVDQGNYSCATDLAMLAHALLQHPLLKRIVGSPSAVLPFPIKGGKLYLYNNNPLYLQNFPGTDGVKTGYTTKAGLCIVATARRGRRWLGVVLLHSGNWAAQAETLLSAGFQAEQSHR